MNPSQSLTHKKLASVKTKQVALDAFDAHRAHHSLTHYTGILSLQAMAHLAIHSGDANLEEDVREALRPFVTETQTFRCNFKNYLCGGNGAALMLFAGHLPEAGALVRKYAEELMRQAPRDKDGIFCYPREPEKERIWIDTAFAVTPFLLYAGLALGEEDYIEEAFQQTAKMFDVLRDDANGLLHQAKNFTAPGRLSEDHWSRGNGWGMLALAELVDALPEGHPRRREAEARLVDFAAACLKTQDAGGLWHQEMTLWGSYPETSGSALILYGIAIGLIKGLLGEDGRAAFVRGLEGLLRHIDADGAIHGTCEGCLNPGDGSIMAYLGKHAVINDLHAFGPVILAFGVAGRLGIGEVRDPRRSA